MRSFEESVALVAPCGSVTIRATVTLPERLRDDAPTPVVFAFPGGGYSRNYFDPHPPGAGESYSMTSALAGAGLVVVAGDNLGTGESSRPSPASRIDVEDLVAGNQALVEHVLGRLRAGAYPGMGGPVRTTAIGLGHSMGAGLVTVQQARHAPYAGIALLGRALTGSPIPAPAADGSAEPRWAPGAEQLADFEASAEIVDGYYLHRAHTPWQRYLFFWDDVPEEVVDYDERHGTTFPLHVARRLGGAGGPNRECAGLVTTPILLAFGERDVTRDPLAEVAAYRASTDIRLLRVPRSAHCHNLSSSRHWLWRRLTAWIGEVAAQAGDA